MAFTQLKTNYVDDVLDTSMTDTEKEAMALFRRLPRNAQKAIIANMCAYLE